MLKIFFQNFDAFFFFATFHFALSSAENSRLSILTDECYKVLKGSINAEADGEIVVLHDVSKFRKIKILLFQFRLR